MKNFWVIKEQWCNIFDWNEGHQQNNGKKNKKNIWEICCVTLRYIVSLKSSIYIGFPTVWIRIFKMYIAQYSWFPFLNVHACRKLTETITTPKIDLHWKFSESKIYEITVNFEMLSIILFFGKTRWIMVFLLFLVQSFYKWAHNKKKEKEISTTL